jgi:hypothetical protein
LRFNGNSPAVSLDDFLADRKADSGARELFSLVQSLEHAEDPVEVPSFDAQAVIRNRKHPLLLALDCRDVHPWSPGFLVFDRVSHQVLEELDELCRIGMNHRQVIVRDQCLAVINGAAQVLYRALKCVSLDVALKTFPC